MYYSILHYSILSRCRLSTLIHRWSCVLSSHQGLATCNDFAFPDIRWQDVRIATWATFAPSSMLATQKKTTSTRSHYSKTKPRTCIKANKLYASPRLAVRQPPLPSACQTPAFVGLRSPEFRSPRIEPGRRKPRLWPHDSLMGKRDSQGGLTII